MILWQWSLEGSGPRRMALGSIWVVEEVPRSVCSQGSEPAGLTHTVALEEVMKHCCGRLSEAKGGSPHLPTWHAAQGGLLLTGSSEPGHYGEKAEACPSLRWFPWCSSTWAPAMWPGKTQGISSMTTRLGGRGSGAREPAVVSSILAVRGKAWGGVDGPCRSTCNRKLIFTAEFWL